MPAGPERRRFLPLGLLAAFLFAAQAGHADNWLDRLLEFTGVAASPGAMKGDDERISGGDIWIADIEGRSPRRITLDPGGYTWPVFMPGDGALLALRGSALVRIPLDGGVPGPLFEVGGVRKLIGFSRQHADLVLALGSDRDHPLQVLSLAAKRLEPLPYDDHDPSQRRLLRHLDGQERKYDGTRLFVQEESKEEMEGTRTWTDVYASRDGGAPRRISACEGDRCGQPSLSRSGGWVVYVREARR